MSKRIMNGISHSRRKLVLFFILLVLVFVLTLTVRRLNAWAMSSLGRDFAMLTTSAAITWMLFFALIGMGLGGLFELLVRKQILVFNKPPRPGSLPDLMLKAWGHKIEFLEEQSAETNKTQLPQGVTMNDVEELLVIVGTRKRRGKKSLYSDEVRFRAVRDWMILQANGTSMTLQQFLEERFGAANDTGMPLVPNQTFYGWRTQFIKELNKYKSTRSETK